MGIQRTLVALSFPVPKEPQAGVSSSAGAVLAQPS